MKTYTSRCGDVFVRGTPNTIKEKYKHLGSTDKENAQIYFQHAEHWRRVDNGETENS
jgi:hypothetical protein